MPTRACGALIESGFTLKYVYGAFAFLGHCAALPLLKKLNKKVQLQL
jgi:hypothetical protein